MCANLSSVMLGPVPSLCNVATLCDVIRPWDKPKDDAECDARTSITFCSSIR